MNTFSHVPPGFRFHPTDEELVDYYLRKKIGSKKIDLDVIKDVDLYKIEPWDLQELCRIGSSIEEENEWYFFSHKDKKYPTGTRTNRATKAGFWKATGRDKAIYSRHTLIGMRKTLVFYKGRAPNGHKSDWIMHEYRLETNENGPPQEEGWVVCRVFKKRLTAAVRKPGDFYDHSHAACTSSSWYDVVDHHHHQVSGCNFMHEHNGSTTFHLPCKQELEVQYAAAGGFPNSQHIMHLHDQPPFLTQLPHLESPNMPAAGVYSSVPDDQAAHHRQYYHQENGVDHQVTDWRVLDKFVASQLSHNEDNINAATSPTDHPNSQAFPEQMKLVMKNRNQDHQYGSTSTSTCHNNIDLWK